MGEVLDLDPFKRLPERYRNRAREISRRVSEIDAMLKPCEPAKVGEAMVRMFRQFREQPGTDHTDMASEYRAACRDLPEWAVSEAANDFLGGRVDNHTGRFMPTCAEFAKRARSIITPFLAERSALRIEASKLIERAQDEHRRHQIEMERQDPNVKRRVKEMVSQFSAGTTKPMRLMHSGIDDEKQKRLDALKKPRPFASKIAQTKIGKV